MDEFRSYFLRISLIYLHTMTRGSPVSTPVGTVDRPLSRRRRVRDPGSAAVQLLLFPERVTLTRIRPALNERRYYQIEIQSDLFRTVVLARRWGRIGRTCRIRLESYPDFGSALDALASLARRKRRRGYMDQHSA